MKPAERSRTALVLMDFQNYGVHPDGYWAKHDPNSIARILASGVVGNAARALAAARERGIRVFHVVNRWRAGHPDLNPWMPVFAPRIGSDVAVEGTWGAAITSELTPAPGEPVVTKRSVSALLGTELERLLRLSDVSTLALGGVATNFVVEGTARDAADLGYRVVVLSDCCETMDETWQRFSLELLALIGEVVTQEEFFVATTG